MATYIVNKQTPYDLVVLQAEINSDANITPSCIGISADGSDLTFDFNNSELTTDEQIELNSIVDNHTKPVKLINVNDLPISSMDGFKLAVHSSAKPENVESTYAMWVGCGDDVNDVDQQICSGEILEFDCSGSPGTVVTKELRFNPIHGRVWVHEAYLRFEGGGPGDCIEAFVVAQGTPLQQVVNLDLLVDNDGYITYAGPGAGTHGFADPSAIRLMPRSFSGDGDWDYEPESITPLLPNVYGNGGYKLNINDTRVHRYYAKIPCRGSSYNYFSMTSDDTAWLPPGFYVEINAHKNSTNDWFACVIVEIYRQRTYKP